MTEEHLIEDELFEDKLGQVWLVAEVPSRDIAEHPRLMATQIRSYFQANPEAIEVLIYKGKKEIVVTRRISENPLFLILFQRKYAK